jgi:RES domain-containing protein
VSRAVVWRIARRPHALDTLGAGARQDGGRWNRPGTGVIYAGSTIAIAALERFVHLAGVVPADLVLVRVTLPDGCSTEMPEDSDLPRGWDLVPPGPASMDFGTRWAQEMRSLVLYVPSVVLREEKNAVLNPAHPEFARVKLAIERPFNYDPRMYSLRRAPGRKPR